MRLSEREGFAMLLGWLEKHVAGCGLSPGREACERFWKEQVRAKPREKLQLDQWAAAMRWYVRWLDHRKAKGCEVRSLPERVRAGFLLVLEWFENFRLRHELKADRAAAKAFWKSEVTREDRPRESWQLEQWGSAPGEIGLMVSG